MPSANLNPVPQRFDFPRDVQRALSADPNPYRYLSTVPPQFADQLLKESFDFAVRRIYPGRQPTQPVRDNELMQLSSGMLRSLLRIVTLEQGKEQALSDLAVRLVTEEFGIKPGEVLFDGKIVGFGSVKIGAGSAGGARDPFAEPDSDIAEEVSKRRIINAFTHGAARNYQRLVHLAKDELGQIDPQLGSHYLELHRGDEAGYWLAMSSLMQLGGTLTQMARAGGVKIEFVDGKPKIVAEAICFSGLLHELGKGVMELQSYNGLPDDYLVQERVFAHTEGAEPEIWDLRYGPKIWQVALEAFNAPDGRARLHALREFYSIPAARFNLHIRDLLMGQGNSAQWLSGIAQSYGP